MSSKSTSKSHASKTSSSRLKRDARVTSQTSIDAKLHNEFDQSELNFDYSTSIDANCSTSTSNVPASTVSAYLQKIQRGNQIQPFGCLIAINNQTLKVLAYSENAPEMLDLTQHAVPNIDNGESLSFGTDIRTLFGSSTASDIQKAVSFPDVNLLNPLLVHCKSSGKPFYAILYRNDIGLVIDLEPVNPADVPVTAAGALKSYKLAAKAITRLQSLQSGNILRLCDVLVKEVRELTGYDRVMVYKFHEDEHGEVIAECRRPDMDPYLGLHYPATDIPQASRFLFTKNKVRMICDCLARPVKVVQTEDLSQPLNLCGSGLRAPHGCHAQYMANMGSIASLVMSVTINDDEDDDDNDDNNDDDNEYQSGVNIQLKHKGKILWGLVVCHHSSARFLPFPLRYACEFLIQVFGVQVNKEVELTSQLREKHILKTQTVLCDMLLRDAPVGIMTQSPNVMDLVNCDGAALYYKNKFWLLGVTPTELQIKDIVSWLLEEHGESTGLSSDSLADAGYPNASALGQAVCGMAAVKISSKDFLFWFRSHTAKEIKWSGAKHEPDDKDDVRKMHPRSSFKAFLEVVKNRSLPWEDVEMDAIHSLQLILRESLQNDDAVARDDDDDDDKKIVSVSGVDMMVQRVDELRVVANEMVRLIEMASVPVFAVDGVGNVSGWNDKIAEITGLVLDQAVGVPLVSLVVDDSVEKVKVMLSSALQGIEEKNVEINLKCFGSLEANNHITLVTNACCSRDLNNTIVGVCFIGQDLTAQKLIIDKYTKVKGDYVSIIRNPCPLIPPIFMMDEFGKCLEWNDAMVKLTGLTREEANKKILLGEVFTDGNIGCRVKDDMLTRLRILINKVMSGLDSDKLPFGFFDQKGKYIEALLSANKRVNKDGKITGVLCFLHVLSSELQHAMLVQRMAEQAALNSLTKVSYLRHELKNGLNGIKFIEDLLDSFELDKEQRRNLRKSYLCREQLAQIVDDSDVESIEQCYMDMKCAEFKLGESLEVVLNQVASVSHERKVEVVFDAAEQILCLSLFGDNLRVQQVLSNFLSNALNFTPEFEGSAVIFRVTHKMEHIGAKVQVAHIEFRITLPTPGIPEKLVHDMFHLSRSVTREGLGLYISQKLVKIMNGSVQYLREADRASFVVLIEFPVSPSLTSVNKRSKKE